MFQLQPCRGIDVIATARSYGDPTVTATPWGIAVDELMCESRVLNHLTTMLMAT